MKSHKLDCLHSIAKTSMTLSEEFISQFIDFLYEENLLYHFEDDPFDCLSESGLRKSDIGKIETIVGIAYRQNKLDRLFELALKKMRLSEGDF